MARIPYADLSAPELAALAERIRAERGGTLLNLFRMLLHSPEIAEAWLGLGGAVRFRSTLDDRSRELAICAVARWTGADYEWAHHEPLARRAGVPADALAALPGWRGAHGFDQRDRAVLAYAEALTLDACADDATFAGVREVFGDRELVELTATIALYGCTARFLNAFDVDLDG